MDALKMGNVRSTPISEVFDSASFSLSLWSPLTPLTRNSSILFELLASEPLAQIRPEDFVVKNGYILSLTETPVVEANTTTGETTYRYPFLVKATVQGQVCVDILKSTRFSSFASRHLLQPVVSPAQPDLSFLLHHTRCVPRLSLIFRLASSRPSPRDSFAAHHNDVHALVHLPVLGADPAAPLRPSPPRPHPSLLLRASPLAPLLLSRTETLHLRHQRRGPASLRRLRLHRAASPRREASQALPLHSQRPPHRPRRQPARQRALRLDHHRQSHHRSPQRLAGAAVAHDRPCRSSPLQPTRPDEHTSSLRASSPG